ncbi:hypothetical protein A2U01_0068572, partial [Trifolium medium]|nr:hypothetical protein [Trifolium medium]
YGRQGITVENRSGLRRSSSKNEVEAQNHKKYERRPLESNVGTVAVDATGECGEFWEWKTQYQSKR